MAAVKVTKCSCKSEYQDARYGEGKRLHNITKDPKGRCTVCGKEN